MDKQMDKQWWKDFFFVVAKALGIILAIFIAIVVVGFLAGTAPWLLAGLIVAGVICWFAILHADSARAERISDEKWDQYIAGLE